MRLVPGSATPFVPPVELPHHAYLWDHHLAAVGDGGAGLRTAQGPDPLNIQGNNEGGCGGGGASSGDPDV